MLGVGEDVQIFFFLVRHLCEKFLAKETDLF